MIMLLTHPNKVFFSSEYLSNESKSLANCLGSLRKSADFLKDPRQLAKDFDSLDKYSLEKNTLFGWVKSIIMPDKYN